MRPLSTALQTALQARTRHPAVILTIEDHTNHLLPYQTPGLPDQWSDACVADDGSIVRVYLTHPAGPDTFAQHFQYTRITDPSQAAQWTTVTTFTGGKANMFQDGGCCISNNHGTLRAFAQQGSGGNALFCWTSTDHGASWSGPVAVVSPPGNALTKGIASAGNDDVFFLYDVYGGETMGLCTFNARWSALSNWSLSNPQSGQGLAVYWTGSQYNLVYSDGYTLSSASYAANTWTRYPDLAPATSDAIVRVNPRLSYYDGLYHLCVNENDGGVISGSVYSYCRVRESADFIHWSDGWTLHDVSTLYGGNLFFLPSPATGSSGARYYFVCPSTVLSTRAFTRDDSSQFLDASASVLSYRRQEQVNKAAELVVALDNRAGLCNGLLNLSGGNQFQPITPEACLRLQEGYTINSSSGHTECIPSGLYHLASVDVERSPGQNQIHLTGLDLSARLDHVARWQNTFSGQTIQWLLLEVCARAGLFHVAIQGGNQLLQVVAQFVLQAGQRYRHALDSLCQTYGLDYFLDQAETLQVREIMASDGSVWNYQPEVEHISFGGRFQRANHVVVSGKPPGTTSYSLTTSERYDDVHNQATRLDTVLHHVDQKLTTTAQTSATAALILYEQQRSQVAHAITVPLNPALQLLDVMTLSDWTAPAGSGLSSQCRIIQHQAIYDAQSAVYESRFSLQGL